MGYNTASTEWPSTLPSKEVKNLIDELFLILDNDGKDAGDHLADRVFAADGVLVGLRGKSKGSEAIRRCRDHSWTVVKKRRHTVMRVYAFDSSSLDLLLIGNVEMGLANGKDILEEFTARVLISPEKSGRLRIDLYQVWADSAPLTRAIQEQ